jgi:murein DD-endopeptidase MepM/ murein hydrolase activator NlpD
MSSLESKSSQAEVHLPFNTKEEIIISQGFDGPYSHNSFSIHNILFDFRFALDFILPLGTIIFAPCDGVVKSIIHGIGEYYEGLDPKKGRRVQGTSIFISHHVTEEYSRGIFSYMQHLDPSSFLVEVGDSVKCGQSLAKTGKTGWIGPIPHLHLHLQHGGTVINI